MNLFKENDRVVFTDKQGQKIDTFVIFDTDTETGLTHINYKNLLVGQQQLRQHPQAIPGFHLPLSDAFSFEILQKLKAKDRTTGKVDYLKIDLLSKAS
jgi:hypothetical protein